MLDPAHPQPADPALPAWVTPALIVSAVATFQPYYAEPLTRQDAVEILLTMGNVFRILSAPESESDHHEHEENEHAEDGPSQALRRAG